MSVYISRPRRVYKYFSDVRHACGAVDAREGSDVFATASTRRRGWMIDRPARPHTCARRERASNVARAVLMPLVLAATAVPRVDARRSRQNCDRRAAAPIASRFRRESLLVTRAQGKGASETTSAAIVEATSAHPVAKSTGYSFARSGFSAECERALNAQINVEYNVSYVYHAMWAFFARDNVALKGFAEHFKKEALEEREHAEQLMEYVNLRGGRVELQQLLPPQTEYEHPEKGCALYALELSLSLEKLNNDKLCELHRVAEDAGDAHMCDFLEGTMMDPQVQSVREVSEMVATLLRMGPPGDGMAAWHFDQYLQNKA